MKTISELIHANKTNRGSLEIIMKVIAGCAEDPTRVVVDTNHVTIIFIPDPKYFIPISAGVSEECHRQSMEKEMILYNGFFEKINDNNLMSGALFYLGILMVKFILNEDKLLTAINRVRQAKNIPLLELDVAKSNYFQYIIFLHDNSDVIIDEIVNMLETNEIYPAYIELIRNMLNGTQANTEEVLFEIDKFLKLNSLANLCRLSSIQASYTY